MNYDDLNLIDTKPYKVYPFKQNTQVNIPGYLLVSTAALNVEDERCNDAEGFSLVVKNDGVKLDEKQSAIATNGMMEEIAQQLAAKDDTEIVINIHGYGYTPADTEIGCKKIYDYINENIDIPNKYIFIGYRWPSENPLKKDDSGKFIDKLRYSLLSLPILLSSTLVICIIINILSIWLLIFTNISFSIIVDLFTVLLISTGIISSMIFTVLTMRISTYFRDTYRANNYGVIDIVEFIRTLDKKLYDLGVGEESRVKLSFIGHSLGCFVVTNVIRILSDVFDVQSINKNPSSNIGNAFSLGRLVMVAPDIPVETILPGRANFLRSCLRRCSEAYIFSNEADLALRFTSTAANYFSFPAKTSTSGYRLGNVTVSHFISKDDRVGNTPKYGIVNLQSDNNSKHLTIDNPYKYLEIRSSNKEHIRLQEMRKFSGTQPTDLFTYFDCTDYKDDPGSDAGILSYALQKPAISLRDYFFLTFAFLRKATNYNSSQGIDTHGGYFEGNFSQKAIYKLAFLGFDGLLNSLSPSGDREEKISAFSEECKNKQIQVVLGQKLG